MSDLQARLQAVLGDAFRVDREIHGGGMSRLFLATEVSLSRLVVVKILPPELTSEVSARRFKQEMEIAARLQHPHILPVLSAGAPEGLLYYITPYVAGESLRARLLRDGALPVPEVVRLLGEIADALAFAHAQGVVHRDIKPENILLEGRHAVLADFGIARALMESQTEGRLTATGLSVGTPGYMSPEQIAGSPDVNPRSDVYSLAVVAYEMLTGQAPFQGNTPQAVIAANISEMPRPVHEVQPGVPAALSDLLARALAKDREARFESAAELGEALAAIAAGAGTGSTTAGRPRARRAAGTAVLTVAGLATVLGLMQLMRGQARIRALIEATLPAAEQADYDSVASVLAAAGIRLDTRGMRPVADRVAGYIALESTPSGARVHLTRVTPMDGFATREAWSPGVAPRPAVPLVAGEYLVRFVWAPADTLELLATVAAGDSMGVHALQPPRDGPGFVRVTAGPSIAGPVEEDFLIGRNEVTNREFEQFLREGGYQNPSFWPDSLSVGGRRLPRATGVAAFVDGSGLPGPRAWRGGRPPEGQEDHPVTGVSWYEAAAYARWADAALPTAAEWWRAALADGAQPFPWGSDGVNVEVRANFSFVGPDPVGRRPLGVSPFGAHDMAGNVREWLANGTQDAGPYPAVGGGWRDPSYMFDRTLAEHHEPWVAHELVGFRLVRPSGP